MAIDKIHLAQYVRFRDSMVFVQIYDFQKIVFKIAAFVVMRERVVLKVCQVYMI